jgi:acyl carrier protein
MPSEMDVGALEARLLGFVRGELLEGRPIAVEADTYLFADGMIDSLKILQLIAFLELQIGREIPDVEIVMAHFRTVRTIAARFGARP